jgi:8-oxo-dGTP pyrophosphatase MutT (NUDIX family)
VSSSALSVAEVARRLAVAPARLASPLWPRCAVAMVLRGDDVLLMRRAVRRGDRWSGHVSLPGGGEELRDADLLATAVRETVEEVGLDLTRSARFLGRLAPHWAMTRGLPRPMSITPFVFAVDGPVELALGREASAAFWFPLGAAASGALDGVHPYRLGPLRRQLPCWRHEGQVVWGLTFDMLQRLLALR